VEKNNLRTMSLNELLLPIRRNWIIVFFSFLSVMITVSFITLTTKPVYEAEATLSIRENNEMRTQLFDMPALLAQKYLLKNQVAHLESRTLAVQTVKKLYNSIYVDSLAILGNMNENGTPTLQDRIWEKLGRKKKETPPPSSKDAVYAFMNATKVTYGNESDIIQLRARSVQPWEASVLVNTWVQTYQEYSLADARGEVTQEKRFLEEKLKELGKEREQAHQALAEFQKNQKVVSLDAETNQLVEQMASLKSMYNETRSELEAIEEKLSYLKEQLSKVNKAIVDDLANLSTPTLKELTKQKSELESKIAAKKAQLIGSNLSLDDRQISEWENRIKGLKQKIEEEAKNLANSSLTSYDPLSLGENLVVDILKFETDRKSLIAKLKIQSKSIQEYRVRMEKLPEQNLQLANLEMNVQVNDNIYIMLRERYERTKIQEAAQLGVSQIVDLAIAPENPVLPNTSQNIFMGFFFGILLGVGLAFSREYFQDTVQNSKDIQSLDVDIIGTVPRYKTKKYSKGRNSSQWILNRAKGIYPYLLTKRNSYSTVAESYRSIRTSIYFANQNRPWKTILVTSAGPSEGKSTTASNLAITIAQKGMRTLLIDADLRRPVLDMLFTGSRRKTGLTNILAGKNRWQEACRETGVKGLYLIGSGMGAKNTSELIGSKSMLRFIRKVIDVFDVIIFDSPPVLAVTDSTVLASLVDGVIIVTQAGKTSQRELSKALDMLKRVKAKIMGAVLTGINRPEMYDYKDYYTSYTAKLEDKQAKKKLNI